MDLNYFHIYILYRVVSGICRWHSLNKGDEEYSSYNYEGGIHESSQYNNEDNSGEHAETNEGLLCEEDETDTLFDDGLEQ